MARWITRHQNIVLIVAILLLIPSVIGFAETKVNYDILSYLPTGIESVDAETILDEEFGEATMSIIIMKDMTWDEMTDMEKQISEVKNVSNVLWIGSVFDSPVPKSMLPDSLSSAIYNKDGDATLMLVQYSTRGSSQETLTAVGNIKKIMNKNAMMSGVSAVTYDLMQLTNQESPKFIAIAILLALAALMFTMDSFLLPVILLFALGLAVLYNMGTNWIFGQISFVTQAVAAILQLAVTMDYSVFLMDRYREEKPKYNTREAAMTKAIVETFTSLAGSSLTTIFGFLALCFMQLTLGRDLGLVMAKGVVLGVVTVVIVLPPLLLKTESFVAKTKHKSLVPNFHAINKFTIKARRIFALIFVALLIPSYILQSNVKKYYNMMLAVPDGISSIEALEEMKKEFNMAATDFIVVDKNIPSDELTEMCNEIQKTDGVTGVISLGSMLGSAISPDILPDKVKSIFYAGDHQLIIVNSIYEAAEDKSNKQVDTITSIVKSYDKNGLVTGEAPMYKDLIAITDRDFVVTNIISIAAIFILIAIIFKSISIPTILVLAIEFAIWINIGICTLQGEVICFVTPTIISSVQLGATVDYAILMTTRFREELRSGKNKFDAMQAAADSSERSIFQSALVFFAACIGVAIICDIDIVSSICSQLARGAVISALVIMIFLPPVLTTSEGVIKKTTYHWRVDTDPTFTLNTRMIKMEQSTNDLRYNYLYARYLKKLEKAEKKGKPLPEPPVKQQPKISKKLAETAEMRRLKAMQAQQEKQIQDEEPAPSADEKADGAAVKKTKPKKAVPVRADYVSGTITSLREAQRATAAMEERMEAEAIKKQAIEEQEKAKEAKAQAQIAVDEAQAKIDNANKTISDLKSAVSKKTEKNGAEEDDDSGADYSDTPSGGSNPDEK